MHPREDLFDALCHRPLVFVEPRNTLALTRVFVFLVITELNVPADRHEVDQVVRQQIEPRAKLPSIEQIGFVIQELLDLLLQFEICETLFHSAALWIGCRSRPSSESQLSPFM